MVDSEYNTHNYKCSRISSGAKMNNSEILRLVPDHHVWFGVLFNKFIIF